MVLKGEHIRQVAAAIYGEARHASIELVRSHTQIADSTAIYLVDGNYILHVSPAAFPDAAAREASSIEAMRRTLREAGRVLPEIAAEGRLDGRSFMVVPRLKPLASGRVWGRIDRIRIRGEVLAWLRELLSLPEPPAADKPSGFATCLTALSGTPGLEPGIASEAAAGSGQLQSGQILPSHLPMHGDLWSGNLLRRPDGRLCVIDWGGALPRGYGIYDLMRLGSSLRIPRRMLRRELAVHQSMLGGPRGARLHLLAALGHYAGNLGEFPRERFVVMARQVCGLYDSLA